MYEITTKLQDNEVLMKVNAETGETKELKKRINNFPKGKSKLDYEDFGMINLKMLPILKKLLTHTEISIVVTMIMKAEYNSNSLAPLTNETSVRQLAEIFNISPTIVNKTFDKLFDLGVYAQLKISTSNGNEFWILNPYIYWKGKLKDDSLFIHFYDTTISKLLR